MAPPSQNLPGEDPVRDEANALDNLADAQAGHLPIRDGLDATNTEEEEEEVESSDESIPRKIGSGNITDEKPALTSSDSSSDASDHEKKPGLGPRSVSAITARTDASDILSRTTSQATSIPAQKKSWTRWLVLKRRHLPPVPKERRVSKEYKAHWFSQMTFQWMTSLMDVGYQRSLDVNDIWLINPNRGSDLLANKTKEAFDKRIAQGSKRPLLMALYETLKFDFLLGGITQLISAVVQVVNPYILRFLINFAAESYEAYHLHNRPPPPIGRGIGLVFAISILQYIQSTTQNQFMYRGMIVGGQARSVLISLIFDKAMKLSGRARAGKFDVAKEMPSDIKHGSKKEANWLKRRLGFGKADPQTNTTTQGWSNGRIINLMSVDTYRVDQASGLFHLIWTGPIEILIALILLLVQINYSALAGFGLLVISTPVLGKAIRSLFVRRQAINKITDQRVSLTQEILSAVRFVKYFGWEISFLDRLLELRKKEIRSIQWLLSIRNAILAVSMSMPIFAAVLAFVTYALTGHSFQSGTIFSSLALFNALRLPLNLLPMVLGQIIDASVSINRIQEFMLCEEIEDQAAHAEESKNAIELVDGAFTWEQSPEAANAHNDKPGKKKFDMSNKKPKKSMKDKFQEVKKKLAIKGKKTTPEAPSSDPEKSQVVVSDSPGSATPTSEASVPFEITGLNLTFGRNELVAVIGGVGSGKTSLLAALAGDMRKTNGSYAINASRAFCPQYAWIQNADVRYNILFGKEYDHKWYNEVVDACALRPDLEMLPNGDATEIGERGITVSGGQKQRLNIARAIYFDAEIVLMDDPLSAVDAHVGRHIMDNAICGLLANKCRVLATHQLWVLQRCDRIVWMDEGKVKTVGTFDELMASDESFRLLIASNAQEEKEEEDDEEIDEDEIADEKKAIQKRKKSKKAAALMQNEEKSEGAVGWAVYKAYFQASGSILVLPLMIFLVILSQGSNIVTSLWLSWWTSNKFDFPVGVWAGGYAALGFAQAFLMFVFSIALSIFGTQASKVLLHRAVGRVLRAPMSFFDTTPLGRITNRFSKDVDTMDNVLADSLRFFCITGGMVVAVFILIIAFYHYFAVALVPLAVLFIFASSYYRASAREIKRFEAVLRSHVFAKFGEGVSGISTIRAYGLEAQFSRTIRESVDHMNSAYYLTMANQRWLSVRLDAIGILLVFVVGILVVTARVSIDPATGGLVLSYILTIVQMLQFVVRQLAEVENNMNSVERIQYYGTELEQEPPLHLTEVPSTWPEKGDIVFDNVEMAYRPGLPLVLKGLDLHVRGGERIGVVGRTGAGKSSIMSTLFRLVEITGGSIKIDGVDIQEVGLADLRSRLSIIPQDPTLFKGTIRSNLDPFGKFTDLQLWSALRQADLVSDDEVPGSATADADTKKGRIHLDSVVEEEGLNFSLGQRQLMALARALVRGSQIIVCDEATSSVDMETDQKIQRTMARAFSGKTLLCIAHRLRTIIHYDRIIVMDQGRIAEVDTPTRLYQRGGIFRGMCDRSNIRKADFAAAREEL